MEAEKVSEIAGRVQTDCGRKKISLCQLLRLIENLGQTICLLARYWAAMVLAASRLVAATFAGFTNGLMTTCGVGGAEQTAGFLGFLLHERKVRGEILKKS